MTSTTPGVRPKTSATGDFELVERTDAAHRTMTEEMGGRHILFNARDISRPPQIVFSRCEVRQATSDTTGMSLVFEPPRMSVAASGSLTSKDYQITLDRLRKLKLEEDQEDQPSEYAYDRTVSLLRDIAESLGMQFPRAIAATGPNRSVRLLWTAGEKEVRVIVGGSQANKSYLYWREFGRSGIEATVNTETLHQYLSWLAQSM